MCAETRYCIPQEWQIVLRQIYNMIDPFDPRCESIAYNYIIISGIIIYSLLNGHFGQQLTDLGQNLLCLEMNMMHYI